MSLGLALKLANATLSKGVGASGPYPAPSGFVWDYVTDTDGVTLTDADSQPLISLFKVS